MNSPDCLALTEFLQAEVTCLTIPATGDPAVDAAQLVFRVQAVRIAARSLAEGALDAAHLRDETGALRATAQHVVPPELVVHGAFGTGPMERAL